MIPQTLEDYVRNKISLIGKRTLLVQWTSVFAKMTSSSGNIFRVTGPLCGEFTGHRWIPLTKARDAELWCFVDLRPNKRLSNHSWGWWFETPASSLWRQCNVYGTAWSWLRCGTLCLLTQQRNSRVNSRKRLYPTLMNPSDVENHYPIFTMLDIWCDFQIKILAWV